MLFQFKIAYRERAWRYRFAAYLFLEGMASVGCGSHAEHTSC